MIMNIYHEATKVDAMDRLWSVAVSFDKYNIKTKYDYKKLLSEFLVNNFNKKRAYIVLTHMFNENYNDNILKELIEYQNTFIKNGYVKNLNGFSVYI